MTDLIQKARKEWCEPWLVEFDANDNEIPVTYDPCPPEVVAALLDVLGSGGCDCSTGGNDLREDHSAVCNLRLAEAAITRALEQKP